MNKDTFITQISDGAEVMGIHLHNLAKDRLFMYYSELQRWNKKVNLVSRQQGDWIRTHFLDSLAPLSLNLLEKGHDVVDLGAGAGFPGVPLKIVQESMVLSLAEASGKKCAWLRHLMRVLEMDNTRVLEGRFDELARQGWAGKFEVAVSRAAAKPWKILDFARTFLGPGGRALIYTTEELVGKEGKVHPYQVPGSKVPSVIWEVQVN